MVFCQSCIVADPPEYRDPGRTRPLLDAFSAVPQNTQILTWNTGQPVIPIAVTVRSEDAGFPLYVRLWLDYGTSSEFLQRNFQLGASTYDQGQEIKIDWQPDFKNVTTPSSTRFTCHVLTLIVAHSDSFLSSSNDLRLDPTKAGLDAAILSWWVNYNAADPSTLADCPSKLPQLIP